MMQEWSSLGIDTNGRTSGTLKTHCPKCTPRRNNKRDKSLSVDLDQGLYNCHNNDCDFSGHVGAQDWRDFKPTPVYQKPDPPSEDSRLGPRSRKFLSDRGIDPDTAAEMGVYSNPKDDAIAIPFMRDGETVHIKYRNLQLGKEKRFWSTKNTEKIFYNLDACRDATDVLITEGEMDVLALMTCGIDTALSVPNGAPGKGQKADGKLDEAMRSGESILENAKRILIAVDADDGGQSLSDELVRRIGPEKCFTVTWPNGCKDANDTLRDHGIGAVIQAVANAKPVPIQGLIYGDDVRESIWRNRHGRQRRGIEVPMWRSFNELYRVGEGHLTIVSGTPSSGKSAFLAAMLTHVATNDSDWKFGVFSPEQAPPDEYYDAMVALRLGASIDSVTREQYDEAMDWVTEHFILEAPEDRTLESILELARVCVLRHGVKGIVIDPWTEVEAMRLPGVNESEHIGQCLARIRAFGQRHRVHMFVAAHPTKPDRLNSDKPIGPYDISGSANWFNKADAMLSIHRHNRTEETSPVDVHVQKIRFKAFGKNGKASFGFDKPSGRYYEIATHMEVQR